MLRQVTGREGDYSVTAGVEHVDQAGSPPEAQPEGVFTASLSVTRNDEILTVCFRDDEYSQNLGRTPLQANRWWI